MSSPADIDSALAPRRVLMTADTVGGVWTYALELARELGDFGVEVALATMGALPSREQYEEARRLPNLSLFKSEFKLEWMGEPWRDVRAAGEWLLHLERRLAPEVIHLNNYPQGALPWAAPKVVVGHSCVLSWWRAVKGEPAPRAWDCYRREVARGVRAADFVVAPSRAMLEALDEHYGPLHARRVITNGRAAQEFAPATKEDFVLTAGRLWDEAKNVGALARVAPRLPWPVYVAGEEKHPDGRAAQFENVRLLGKLSCASLASWMARASVYALPARYEPFGLSALEAALSGCALVLGDIASLREVWGDAALFVAPGDEEALEAALRELMNDHALRRTSAERARHRAAQFTPRRMARGYLEVYAALLSGIGRGVGAVKERFACAS
jgi:glycogen(starch) synthase